MTVTTLVSQVLCTMFMEQGQLGESEHATLLDWETASVGRALRPNFVMPWLRTTLPNWRLKTKRKNWPPSLGSLTLGPEPVFLFSPHQEAAPYPLHCLQCPGTPSPGNGPRRPRAVQGTDGDGICLLHPSTVPADSTLVLMCTCQSQLVTLTGNPW